MNWSEIFDESYPESGAGVEEIAILGMSLGLPLSADELASIQRWQINPFPASHPFHASYRPFDPTQWTLSAQPLPASYLDLLQWSNGGEFRTGERWFQFFPALHAKGGVRAMLLAYHLPQYMPGALPFAFNGGGVFYLFDTRKEPAGGEFPIVCAAAGNLGWEESRFVADTLEAACRGKTNIEDFFRTGSE